ncbi:SMC-Scp complex subunit ScpB [Catellatospora bangladeshensis]|uniref:Segregation and condensation protein B n=1 Tax=Catellatospora bangladeshensis TaxID=310355 RepID=A0A8J3JR46_9ACTN|nr:hypothetical protein Cba03nite_64970 [Catellatospora bangladeshensis]
MTDHESLEQQAAAWVPPWARTPTEESKGTFLTENVEEGHLLNGEQEEPQAAAAAPDAEADVEDDAADSVECGPEDLAGPLDPAETAVHDEPEAVEEHGYAARPTQAEAAEPVVASDAADESFAPVADEPVDEPAVAAAESAAPAGLIAEPPTGVVLTSGERDEPVADTAADPESAADTPATEELPEPAADTAAAPEDELTEPADTAVTTGDEPSEQAPAEVAEFVTVEDAAGAESGDAAVQEAAVEELAEALGAADTERFDVDGLDDSGEAAVAVAASQLAAPPPGLDEAELIPALEAILLVVDEPVSEITLAEVLEVPAELVAGTLIDLSATYTRQNRGFDLRRAAGGWRLYTRAAYAPYVERFVLDGQQLRLTQASLETLAVVAYKQPVTRSRISAIRGVNCDGVIRTLVTRGMIEECGTEPESGAHLYRTTSLFLEKLGLDSVEQLPPLAPFLPDNVEEIADEQR